MKKMIIQAVVALGIILGNAFAAQAATQPPRESSESTTAVEERIIETVNRVCDNRRIGVCRTDCVRRCVQGPRYRSCTTACDRDCRARFCR